MVCSVGTGTVAEYYLGEQTEYYTGGNEPHGQWYTPDGQFGLENGSAIKAETFYNLHSGCNPAGEFLGQNNQGFNTTRIGGYDLTFSAPKSVSVLWAVADERVRAAIEQAQEKASRQALDILSKHASYTRRGKGGKTLEQVNMFGATFQHGEARPSERADGTVASDPQLHTHCVIFNMAERDDGTWGSLDGRHLYKWKMTAGAIYRAELANELRATLGVDVDVQENGLFEVAGVAQDIREHFSTRRNEINDELATRGLKSKESQAIASQLAKSTRQTKVSVSETAETRHDRWQREAKELGFGDQEISECLNGACDDNEKVPFSKLLHEIPGQLTEYEAVFRAEMLYRVVAEAALSSGVSMEQADRSVEQLIEEGRVVEIGHDELGLPVFSTSEMINIERDLVEIASRRCRSRRLQLPENAVEPRLNIGGLSDEQKEAVRFATRGRDVVVLEGAAGAGKTYALKTVTDAYQDQGYRVIGTATAWRMANQLGGDLEVATKATDAWLAQSKVGDNFLDSNTVLIVDEAGQLSSSQMLKIMKEAEQAKAKVILTGDQKQLQAIGAGPGLRTVAEQVGVVRIDTIVRQREAWARQAVTDLSLGRTEKALTAFERHDAVHWCSDGQAAVEQAVCDWKSFKQSEPEKTALVMAKSNAQVRSLNEEMRQHLKRSGIIHGYDHHVQVITSSGLKHAIPVAEGDQVIFKRRIDDLGVINGTLATVVKIDEGQDGLKFQMDIQGQMRSFYANDIVDQNGCLPLAHGYASTIYSAQGATVDAAFVVADHSLKRNEAYVAASRARDKTSLYLDESAVEKTVRAQMPLSGIGRSSITMDQKRDLIVKSWEKNQVKSSALDYSQSHEITRDMDTQRQRQAQMER